MASSLLALLDDIATIMDDVAVLTKLSVKKTAGVLGDDLALNAEQASGVTPSRELPVVWAIAKGSFINKLILVPLALIISAVMPGLVTPLLMLGGLYLCYEGFEKIQSHFSKRYNRSQHHKELIKAVVSPQVDMLAFEKGKIKNAIRTDFILSAEIIAITLGEVSKQPLVQQLGVLSAISMLMTVGVYGLVAGIVKLDDAGLALHKKNGQALTDKLQKKAGQLILVASPWLMKTLSVLGTAAMFLVGGGIFVHGFAGLEIFQQKMGLVLTQLDYVGGFFKIFSSILFQGMVGLMAGMVVWSVKKLFLRK